MKWIPSPPAVLLGFVIGFAFSSVLFNVAGVQDNLFGPVGVDYEWRDVAGRPDQHALFLNRKQIGVWDERRHEYRSYFSAIGFSNYVESKPPVEFPNP
jgi:hypothetical protein